MLDELGLIHAVRYLGDNDAVMLSFVLDFGFAANHDFAATCLVGLSNAIISVDNASCGEVGSLDVLHQFINGDVGIVDIGADAIDAL